MIPGCPGNSLTFNTNHAAVALKVINPTVCVISTIHFSKSAC